MEDGTLKVNIPQSTELSVLIPVLQQVCNIYTSDYAGYAATGNYHTPILMVGG